MAYVEAAIKAGLDVDKFAPRVSFFFNAHNNFLEEVAKFRAARRMWARIMREHFKAKNPRSWMLRFHTQTAGSTLTAQQPENNIVRTAIQALAAVLGGTQSLHTNSYDEALALPTEQAARIALRTQQVIAYESGAPQTIDPLAGSYYVEALTDAVEKEALGFLERIESRGLVEAINSGWLEGEMDRYNLQFAKEIQNRERLVVGLNVFKSQGDPPFERFAPLKVSIKNHVERFVRFRSLGAS